MKMQLATVQATNGDIHEFHTFLGNIYVCSHVTYQYNV